MGRRHIRILKLVMLTWIASVSTLLGVIIPVCLNQQNVQDQETTAMLLRSRHLEMSLTEDDPGSLSEREYLTPRTYRVNPINYEYILEGGDAVCGKQSPFLLIVVPSIPGHFETREAIRKTYGSFADNSVYNSGMKGSLNVSISLLFVLGNAKSEVQASLIKNENTIYGDILQGNFTDTYHNLTRKMLLALKWISNYCEGVTYMFKIDEDVFVNIPLLVTYLKTQPFVREGYIFGKIHAGHQVMRAGRWAVSEQEYPLPTYPAYAAGNSYVISGHILPLIFFYSEYLPYLSIEDAFITGCLGAVVGAKKISLLGFTWWDIQSPGACVFYERRMFTGNRITVPYMYKLWTAYVSYQAFCKHFRNEFLRGDLKEFVASLQIQYPT